MINFVHYYTDIRLSTYRLDSLNIDDIWRIKSLKFNKNYNSFEVLFKKNEFDKRNIDYKCIPPSTERNKIFRRTKSLPFDLFHYGFLTSI